MSKEGNLIRTAKKLIIDPENWTQKGVYVDNKGCICAQGALNRAHIKLCYSVRIHDNCCFLMNKAVKKRVLYKYLTGYNDDPSTSHEDIMSLFDEAEKMADRHAAADPWDAY